MNKEILEAVELIEKEKDIPKEVMFEAIENSLHKAFENHFGKRQQKISITESVTQTQMS